jgi:hypothetical protein
MNRSNQQNKRLYYLLQVTLSFEQKAELVSKYTSQRTCHSSEMSEEECEVLISELQELANTMDKQRKRIFAKIRAITGTHAHDKLSEATILSYLNQIKNLTVQKKTRLSDYDSAELKLINKQLDCIKEKSHVAQRKKMRVV